MVDNIQPPINIRQEEDPFLIPPGQPESYVDRLALGQAAFAESPAHSTVTCVVELALGITVIILRRRA